MNNLKIITLILAFFVATILQGCSSDSGSDPWNGPIPTPNRGAVSGTVKYVDTQAPVNNAYVELVQKTTEISASYQTNTNVMGEYSFASVIYGKYEVSVKVNDKIVYTTQLVVDKPEIDFSPSIPNVVPAISAISGTIIYESSPLSGATVFIGTQSVTTDTNGDYNINTLPQGTYFVSIFVNEECIYEGELIVDEPSEDYDITI